MEVITQIAKKILVISTSKKNCLDLDLLRSAIGFKYANDSGKVCLTEHFIIYRNNYTKRHYTFFIWYV
jgi:hypothetical protein